MRILQLVRMAFLPRVYIFHHLLSASLPRIKAFSLQMMVLKTNLKYQGTPTIVSLSNPYLVCALFGKAIYYLLSGNVFVNHNAIIVPSPPPNSIVVSGLSKDLQQCGDDLNPLLTSTPVLRRSKRKHKSSPIEQPISKRRKKVYYYYSSSQY